MTGQHASRAHRTTDDLCNCSCDGSPLVGVRWVKLGINRDTMSLARCCMPASRDFQLLEKICSKHCLETYCNRMDYNVIVVNKTFLLKINTPHIYSMHARACTHMHTQQTNKHTHTWTYTHVHHTCAQKHIHTHTYRWCTNIVPLPYKYPHMLFISHLTLTIRLSTWFSKAYHRNNQILRAILQWSDPTRYFHK